MLAPLIHLSCQLSLNTALHCIVLLCWMCLSLNFHIYDIYDKRGFSRISIRRVGDDPTRDTVLGQAYDELYLSFNWTGVKEI